jgi:hypothetical protein
LPELSYSLEQLQGIIALNCLPRALFRVAWSNPDRLCSHKWNVKIGLLSLQQHDRRHKRSSSLQQLHNLELVQKGGTASGRRFDRLANNKGSIQELGAGRETEIRQCIENIHSKAQEGWLLLCCVIPFQPLAGGQHPSLHQHSCATVEALNCIDSMLVTP